MCENYQAHYCIITDQYVKINRERGFDMYNFPLADSHVHTKYSFDGISTLRCQLDKAEELKLRAIAITDHLDIVPEEFQKEKFVHMQCVKEIEKLRPEYHRINILCGTEIGQAAHYPELANEYLSLYDWDFILASVHNIRAHEDFYFLDFRYSDPHDIYIRYLDEILETIGKCDFDSLAHLTYPLRYIVKRDGREMPYEKYAAKYDEILSLLIEKEKALEINTSAIKNGGTPSPEKEIINHYAALGGRLVTLGSDAHEAKYLASDFDKARDLLLGAGINTYVYFEKRRIKEELPL